MIGKDEIARAVSDADALAEEHEDLPAYWRARGVDIQGLGYVAMQRGLRAVMMVRGENPNTLGQWKTVHLSPEEERLQMAFASAFMDGFAARDAIKEDKP
jgi:hypothetical protein